LSAPASSCNFSKLHVAVSVTRDQISQPWLIRKEGVECRHTTRSSSISNC
jgi:hypothetical protein